MSQSKELKLNIQYASMQIPYWMGYSVLGTFTSVFLLSRDFSNSQIGIILSLANLIAAILQPFMASFADRMQRLRLSQLTALMAALLVAFSVILLLLPKVLGIVAVVYVLLYVCLLLLQPLTISIGTFFISRGYSLNFGLARGLGSLAFAVASMVTGLLLERFSTDVILYLLMGIFTFFFFAALAIDTRKQGGRYSASIVMGNEDTLPEEPVDLMTFFKRYRRFMVLLGGMSLIFVFHSIGNSYMYQIVQPLGGDKAEVGASLSIAALCELPTMFLFSSFMHRFKYRSMMRMAAIFFTVKAVMYLFAPNIMTINLAQATQLTGFALYTMTSVYYTNKVIPQHDLIKGQTLMAMTNTVGGIIGSFLGGQLLNFLSVHSMLLIGTLISGLGTLIVFLSAEDV